MWAIRHPIPRRRYWLLALAGFVVPLGLWWGLAASGGVDPVFLPGPRQVLARVGLWASEDGLLGDVGISVGRVVAGWALSALVALPLGLFIGTWRAAQALLEPLTDFVRYMPAVAFVPLVMLWVGIDEGAKVAIIFIGTFFQMVLMVAEDTRRVPMAQIEAAQTMGATRREIVEKVIVPSSKPALLDTLRITMGWAWTYLVVAELVAANSGLGFAILKAQRFLQTDKIFAGILLIGLIGLVIDQLFRLAHRLAFPYLHARH
ncbi:ABC transporter permease [Caldimonas brevitalea]|uniref:Nitrate transport permease nrtB n=1 Tax=Caldimonas brevitalea TaxID=413882 RepID=A0A0G3BR03_9BURK|nr:ABC transporter permease [Caldimonas brevitalea]AKJ29771.1 nitrate transport permease nrtB [Caldimonas brevitalea]